MMDLRNLWKEGEATCLLTGQENVVYYYQGNVFYHCPQRNTQRMMAYGGFEKDARA